MSEEGNIMEQGARAPNASNGQESDHAVQKAYDFISNVALEEGVDIDVIVSKLTKRVQSETNRPEEPQCQKQRLGVPEAPIAEQQNTISSLQETAWGVFLLNGLKYLSNDILFPSFALLDKNCQQKAMQEVAIRCKEAHPSLYAAITAADTDDNAPSLSYGEWKRFELGEKLSRKTEKRDSWPMQLSDAVTDIDALLEVRRGTSLVCQGMTPLALEEDELGQFICAFEVPHWGFDAPLPGQDDTFFGEQTMYIMGGSRLNLHKFFFWCGRNDCSVMQKTLCKAFYGAHSSHLVQTMPPLHIHIVLRRRSTGKMVTIISQDVPNQIIGEDYGNEPGDYHIHYDNASDPLFEFDGDFYASARFTLFCTRESGEDLTTNREHLSFSTRDAHEMDDQPDGAKLHLCFGLCNAGGRSCRGVTLAALQRWFQE
jgi:hypothetical protein